MKKIISIFCLCISIIAVLLSLQACVKDLEKEGISNTTQYIGTVVEKSTMEPVEGVSVQVTDGSHVHAVSVTDRNGRFKLTDINFDDLGDDCYLWLDATSLDLPSKQEPLMGLGEKVYDYKTIILYDKTNVDLLPRITTGEIKNIRALSARALGNVTADGGHEILVRGICYATHQTPTLEDSVITAGAGLGEFSVNMRNLTKSTTYYVRAYATNNIATTFGAQMAFTTQSGVATFTTNDATNVTATSATISGSVSDDGGDALTVRGFCYAKTQEPTISDSITTDGSDIGTFSHTLHNLELNTTYYYRPYATNTCGTSYGPQKSFTTQSGLPTVLINNVSDTTATSAVCGGSISNNGGFAVSDKGLVWSTSQYPTLNDNHISLGSGDAPFVGSLTNLSISTTYYVRAYATNSQGTAYSGQREFTTSNGLPTVTTTNASKSGNSVVSGGNVVSDGGFPVTARGICYGVYPNPDLSAAYIHTSNGSGTGYFTSVIDTTVGRTLYARAYATNANGTSYGNQIIVDIDYLSLPTFTYNGHTYRVAPDPHTSYDQYISWDAANSYCENLTAYGYSDWRMPTIEELETMYQNRNAIGGFIIENVYDVARTNRYYAYYHSSTRNPGGSYFISLRWLDGIREGGGRHDSIRVLY